MRPRELGRALERIARGRRVGSGIGHSDLLIFSRMATSLREATGFGVGCGTRARVRDLARQARRARPGAAPAPRAWRRRASGGARARARTAPRAWPSSSARAASRRHWKRPAARTCSISSRRARAGSGAIGPKRRDADQSQSTSQTSARSRPPSSRGAARSASGAGIVVAVHDPDRSAASVEVRETDTRAPRGPSSRDRRLRQEVVVGQRGDEPACLRAVSRSARRSRRRSRADPRSATSGASSKRKVGIEARPRAASRDRGRSRARPRARPAPLRRRRCSPP